MEKVSEDLAVEINEYKGRDGEIFYTLYFNYKDEVKWRIEKRFEDFEELQKILAKRINELPYLPPKALPFFSMSPQELDERMRGLDVYMRLMVKKLDCMYTEEFREFIQLERFFDYTVYDPKLIASIDLLPMSVSEMVFVPDERILLIGMSEASALSLVESFITLNLFKKSVEDTGNYLGGVIAYAEGAPVNSFRFNQLWRKNTIKGVSTMCWDDGLGLLAVGMEDGNIECLSIPVDKGFKYYQEFGVIRNHVDAVTGIGFDKNIGHIFSVGKDKYLFFCNLAKQETVTTDEKLFLNELTGLITDTVNKRLFISDIVGNIFIYAYDMKHFYFLTTLKIDDPIPLTSLSMDTTKSFLITSSNEGGIYVFDLASHSNIKNVNLTTVIPTQIEINHLIFDKVRRELYIGGEKGNIYILNSSTSSIFYSWAAHTESINRLLYLPTNRILISASKDRSIKLWFLPEIWSKDVKDIGPMLSRLGILEKLRNTPPEPKVYQPSLHEERKDAFVSQKKKEPLQTIESKQIETRPNSQQDQQSNAKIDVNDPLQPGLPARKQPVIDEDDDEDLGGWSNNNEIKPPEKVQNQPTKTQQYVADEDEEDLGGWNN